MPEARLQRTRKAYQKPSARSAWNELFDHLIGGVAPKYRVITLPDGTTVREMIPATFDLPSQREDTEDGYGAGV